MLPWASVATPTHPDEHANAPRSKYSLQKTRNMVYRIREIFVTVSEKYVLQNHHHGHHLLDQLVQMIMPMPGANKSRCLFKFGPFLGCIVVIQLPPTPSFRFKSRKKFGDDQSWGGNEGLGCSGREGWGCDPLLFLGRP